MENGVIAGRLDPIDVGYLDHDFVAAPLANGKALRLRGRHRRESGRQRGREGRRGGRLSLQYVAEGHDGRAQHGVVHDVLGEFVEQPVRGERERVSLAHQADEPKQPKTGHPDGTRHAERHDGQCMDQDVANQDIARAGANRETTVQPVDRRQEGGDHDVARRFLDHRMTKPDSMAAVGDLDIGVSEHRYGEQHGPDRRQAPVERSFLHRRHFCCGLPSPSSQSISGVQHRSRARPLTTMPIWPSGRSSRVAFLRPRLGSTKAAADSGGTKRSPDGIITSAGFLIFDGTMRLPPTTHLLVPGRFWPYQPTRHSRAVGPASGAPSFSQSSSSTKSRAWSPCWSMPRKRPNFFTASQGSSDQNRVCRISTGSSPTRSAISARSGPAETRKAWPVRSAWKSQGAASSASPATRRGRRAASATVSVPPMQYPITAGARRARLATKPSARSRRAT